MLQKLSILFFSSLTFLSLPGITPVFAQSSSSNCVITQVGNPKTSPTLPAGCNGGGLTDILSWGQKINDALTPGYDYGTGDTWYDKMMADICNGGYCATKSPSNSTADLYWCTFTVVDSFNLAGRKGLTLNQLAVIDMVKFWKTNPGYVYLDYAANHQAALSKVVPGNPFFLAESLEVTQNEEHTGLVKSITLDANGNGSIVSLESNSTEKSHTFPIENWDVKNVFFTLQGFGGVQ